MQDTVDLGRGGRRHALRPAPGRGEGAGFGAAAFVAGAVAGGERRRLVEKEDLGIARAHHRAVPVAKGETAADPGPASPARGSERPVVSMQPAAAIPQEEAADGYRLQAAIGGAAVLQGRGAAGLHGGEH